MASHRVDGRTLSALVDGITWSAIFLLVSYMSTRLWLWPLPEMDHGTKAFFSLIPATIAANAYLIFPAAWGTSLGKRLCGLKLVAVDRGGKPGLVRGLLRGSLQAPISMGLVMLFTGWHDEFAGTRIILRSQSLAPDARPAAAWTLALALKLLLAVTLQLLAPLSYLVAAAI